MKLHGAPLESFISRVQQGRVGDFKHTAECSLDSSTTGPKAYALFPHAKALMKMEETPSARKLAAIAKARSGPVCRDMLLCMAEG